MTAPRITLVTPTFNRVEYLEECILSVIGQDYPNLEYIICDGGSSNTAVLDVIKKYQSHLSWWDSRKDRGHAEAVRRGFTQSHGEIMNYLCSDDYLLPGCLWSVADGFNARPDADVVYGDSLLVDATGQVIREVRTVPATSAIAIITCTNLFQPSMFWKRSLYEHVGGNIGGQNYEFAVFEPNVDLLYRFAKYGARFSQTRKPFTVLRQHAGAVSAQNLAEIRRIQQFCLRRDFPFWGHPLIYPALRKFMRLRMLLWHLAQGDLNYLVKLARLKRQRSSTAALAH